MASLSELAHRLGDRERPPFPVWMTEVSQHMQDIVNRVYTVGDFVHIPALTQLHYALYCDIDPRIAAVLIMKDAYRVSHQGML